MTTERLSPPSVQAAAREAAHEAHLRYISDARPGIRRERNGDEWRYLKPDGALVTDAPTLHRIATLAIPPAWTDVWISPLSNGHLQATGRDARGRKQYRYHTRWRAVRDETKFERTIAFGQALPRIRERVRSDLALPGLPREKVLAALTDLMDRTSIRVGSEEYARENASFGLTTLRDKHVRVEGAEIRFRFRGKSGKEHSIRLRDRRLARIVQRCRDLPGYELFQYLDDAGEQHAIDAADVNGYLREATGEDFTAKDFRTWNGTLAAALALEKFEPFSTPAEAKRNIVRAIELVAAQLGNTVAVCRKCYVHPAVLEAYLEGELNRAASSAGEATSVERGDGLEPNALALLGLLQARAAALTDGPSER
jgi:DNA topoisomerase-1